MSRPPGCPRCLALRQSVLAGSGCLEFYRRAMGLPLSSLKGSGQTTQLFLLNLLCYGNLLPFFFFFFRKKKKKAGLCAAARLTIPL